MKLLLLANAKHEFLKEAKVDGSKVQIAMDKMIKFIQRKMDEKLIRIPGVEHFHNSADHGYGFRYVFSGTTRCLRFNWASEPQAGKTNEIHSIDIFSGKSSDPTFSIHCKGISFAQALPALVTVLHSPSVGRVLAFPVSPTEALTESTIQEARRIPSTLGKAMDEFFKKEFYYDDMDNDMTKRFNAGLPSLTSEKFSGQKHYFISSFNAKKEELLKTFLKGKGFIIDDKYDGGISILPKGKLAEAVIMEVARDAYSPEQALSDFLQKLTTGKTFTRSEFIGSYHIINAGVFDTIYKDFGDKFQIDAKRVSMKPGTKIDALKDSILSKAGVLTVTDGGTEEKFLKTAQEEQVEKDVGDKVPFGDSLEHLEGLVTGTIKGAFNALFVAGKGGSISGCTSINIIFTDSIKDDKNKT